MLTVNAQVFYCIVIVEGWHTKQSNMKLLGNFKKKNFPWSWEYVIMSV